MTTKFILAALAGYMGLAPAMYADCLVPAVFDDLPLAPESEWHGDEEDEDYFMGTFTDGSFEFSNYFWADYNAWGFFGYANYTSSAFGGTWDMCHTACGGGYNSNAYGVACISDFMGPTFFTVTDYLAEGIAIPGMWVVNTAWVKDAVHNGDGFNGPFGQGDLLTIVANGYGADDSVRTVTMPMADYTSADPAEWHEVNEWEWFDLSPLGDVIMVEFTMETTKTSAYGATTPLFFAFDDLGVSSPGTGVGETGSTKSSPYRIERRSDGALIEGRGHMEAEVYSLEGRLISSQSGDSPLLVALPEGLSLVKISGPEGTSALKVCR